MEEAMERGRLTNRVGFNANTGQSWQFTGYARKTSQSSRRVHLPLTACLLRTDGQQQQQQQQHTKTTTEAAAIRSQGAACLKRQWRRRRRPDLRTSMIFRQHARRSRLTQPRSAGLSFATERTLAKSSRTASKQEEEEGADGDGVARSYDASWTQTEVAEVLRPDEEPDLGGCAHCSAMAVAHPAM